MSTLSRTDVKALVRPIYEATETGDVTLLDAVLAEDAVEHPLNPGQLRGREAIKQLFGAFHMMVPDLRLTIQDMIADGDKVAVRSIVQGSPADSYLGVPANGRSMEFEAIDVWRTENSRVMEGWHVEDFVRVLIDWGVMALPRRPSPRRVASQATRTSGTTGSTEAAKDTVRCWYIALHRGDLAALDNILSNEFVSHDPLGPGLAVSHDEQAARQDLISLNQAFPDLDVTLADVFAEDDRVVARVLVRGTQLGPLPGVPPTGKRIAVMGNEIWRVSGGRLVEHWGRFEDLDLLQQLGIVHSPQP